MSKKTGVHIMEYYLAIRIVIKKKRNSDRNADTCNDKDEHKTIILSKEARLKDNIE